MDNKIMDAFQEFQELVAEKFEEHGGMASELYCAFMVMNEFNESEEAEEDCGCMHCRGEDQIDFDKLRGIVPDALLDAVLGKEKVETFIAILPTKNDTAMFFQDAGGTNYKLVTDIKEATVMSRPMAEMVANYIGGKVARKK